MNGSKWQFTGRYCWLVCSLVMNLVFLCPDVDECAQGNLCLGGVCANTEGSYTCTKCKAGYRVSHDRQRCEGKSNSTVTAVRNVPGQSVSLLLCFATEFPPYIIQSYSDVEKYLSWCVFYSDIDECQSLSTCANGICLNSEGSYICENCPTGYRVSYNGELCEGWFI